MKRIALALLMLAAAPAFGAELPFSPFDMELQTGVLETAPALTPPASFLAPIKLVSGAEIALDRTPMSALTEAFDVAPQTYQYVGYTTVWVCFTHAGRRVWYVADLTYETRDDQYVSIVIDEPADPATDEIYRCKAEPNAMLASQPAVPTVGATLAELNKYYGAQMPEGTHYAQGYASNDEVEGATVSQLVYYRLKDGIVDAVSIGGSYMDGNEP